MKVIAHVTLIKLIIFLKFQPREKKDVDTKMYNIVGNIIGHVRKFFGFNFIY